MRFELTHDGRVTRLEKLQGEYALLLKWECDNSKYIQIYTYFIYGKLKFSNSTNPATKNVEGFFIVFDRFNI